MYQYVDYPFRVNISVENYESKEDAIRCLSSYGAKSLGREKMAFREWTITTSQFLVCATSGYTFCEIFQYDPGKKIYYINKEGKPRCDYPVYRKGANKGAMKLFVKSDEFYLGSQVVFVDVDYTRFQNISDYISVLRFPPTCVYMSYSDNKEKNGIISRRFRLVYIFDRLLNKDEFAKVSKSITQQIELDTQEPMQDDCGTRPSQYFNGVFGNPETNRTDVIYQIWDFPEPILPPPPLASTETKHENTGIHFDEHLVADMESLSYDVFMHYYSRKYPRIKRSESPFWLDSLYQFTDDSYLQTWYYPQQVKDGEHRRRKLYKNVCLRLLICPNMDPNTALFNAYIDRHWYFDNSDGVLTISVLQRKVKKAFNATRAELEVLCKWERYYWREHRPQFILMPGIRVTKGVIKDVQRRINYSMIDIKYDRTKSIRENIDAGIGVPERTLYAYAKNRGIDTNPNKPKPVRDIQKEKNLEKSNAVFTFRRLYDPSKTLRQNLDILRSHGLSISSPTTIQKWKEKYIDKDEPAPFQPTSPFITPNTNDSVPRFNWGVGWSYPGVS